jgi:hypothetical protein
MSKIKLMLLSIVAALAMSAVVANAALAEAQQEFNKTPVKTKVTGTSGAAVLTAGGQKVSCKEDTNSGKAGLGSIKNITVIFKGCSSENAKTKAKCEVQSKASKGGAGVVETNELSGELGEVAAAEAKSEVGLLLVPASGNVFVTLEGTCLQVNPTAVEGSIVGEVTPTKTLSTEGKVVFALTKAAQSIKKFERGRAEIGGKEDEKVTPKLTVFNGKAATEETTDTNTFEEALEVLPGA